MLKRLFALLLLGGLGYAAYTVPIDGRTAFQRAYDASPWMIVPRNAAQPTATANNVGRKKAAPAADKAPAERITQADRDALDRLLPH